MAIVAGVVAVVVAVAAAVVAAAAATKILAATVMAGVTVNNQPNLAAEKMVVEGGGMLQSASFAEGRKLSK